MIVAASMNQDRSTYHFYVSKEGRETQYFCSGSAGMILNDQMVVDASQALAWLAASHLGCLPNASPEKMILT